MTTREKTFGMLAFASVLAVFCVVGVGLAQPQASPQPLVPSNPATPAAPVQPIPFSHRKHLALDPQCQTCHSNAEPGALMTFPATATCMSCHEVVATDKPAIVKLTGLAKSQQPIPWVRVYSLLPGVQWSHRKHLQAGVKCETCHGPVADMDAMAMVTSITAMEIGRAHV